MSDRPKFSDQTPPWIYTIEQIEKMPYDDNSFYDAVNDYVTHPTTTFEGKQRALARIDFHLGEEATEITQEDIDLYIESIG